MKFGVREICNVVFKAKAETKIGTSTFKKGQPVLYIDTAKTSTIEGAATTVYATGGRGNTNLIAWEGEKTLTFTVEDALLSPVGFSVLSGAGLFKQEGTEVHVHTTSTAYVGNDGVIDLEDVLGETETIDATAPVFVMTVESDGSLTGEMLEHLEVSEDGKTIAGADDHAGATVFVDFYIVKNSAKVSELQIDAANFGGYYYVEASTLFRDQNSGVDMPAEITLPNVKIQSNFTFSMASTGDPSTFTFTMDAFPGYTMFDRTKKVLCVIQIVEDAVAGSETRKSVMEHETGFNIFDEENGEGDSTDLNGEAGSNEDAQKKTEIDSSILVMFPQSKILLDKPVSDMISADTYVASDGSVQGTIKYISDFEEFNSTNILEQKGYYFPFDLKKTGSKMTFIKNGAVTKSNLDFDNEILFRVSKGDTWTVKVDGEDAVTLTFSDAIFEPQN